MSTLITLDTMSKGTLDGIFHRDKQIVFKSTLFGSMSKPMTIGTSVRKHAVRIDVSVLSALGTVTS
jgi:hypothetical protein